MTGNQSKQQAARDKKVRQIACSIAQGIAAIPTPANNEQVLKVFEDQNCAGLVLCDAFWMLDSGFVRFEHYELWHPRLRGLRNTPVDGERLFALFN